MNTRKIIFGLFATSLLVVASCTNNETADDNLYEVGIHRGKITKGTDGIHRGKITKGTDAIERKKLTKGTDGPSKRRN